jgi:hypothetical protein
MLHHKAYRDHDMHDRLIKAVDNNNIDVLHFKLLEKKTTVH